MIKYKLSATIPVVQYGNLIPEIELEGESAEELHSVAMAHINTIWKRYGERQMEDKDAGGTRFETFTGETVLYNDDTHEYYDLEGNKLLSGSKYAKAFEKPFDKTNILPKTAKAWGVEAGELDDIWRLNADISQSYGLAVHSGLELFLRHQSVGARIAEKKGIQENYATSKVPHVNLVVSQFFSQFDVEGMEPEVLISDVANKMAGRLDILQIVDRDKKVCRIGDYKTNGDLDDKKIEKYQHQLSFYAKILENKGWKVDGLDIYHYSNEWNHIDVAVIDLRDVPVV